MEPTASSCKIYREILALCTAHAHNSCASEAQQRLVTTLRFSWKCVGYRNKTELKPVSHHDSRNRVALFC
ncbi:hypothetical protein Q7C36_018478 [Tachysurus vachellii]|uniref:Uncharacterized protein n=1 Tax=Tachysurus vachellii TaxID=175792 RepID=A0AA88M170_TACVA|nr:hypothetical protein Q7C36_018478 [Tachysurus vachellii]